MGANKQLAKSIILEIIRQANGTFGKTKLFKAFWLAHRFYAKQAKGYLSDWPIIRMPYGPGIDRADDLTAELIQDDMIETCLEPKGQRTEFVCKIKDKTVETGLSKTAIDSIREAIEYVKGHSADSISNHSHDLSRSWHGLPNGVELHTYTDLIPDEEYREKKQSLREMNEAYEKLFE